MEANHVQKESAFIPPNYDLAQARMKESEIKVKRYVAAEGVGVRT
jgi:hypothetical protein